MITVAIEENFLLNMGGESHEFSKVLELLWIQIKDGELHKDRAKMIQDLILDFPKASPGCETYITLCMFVELLK